MTPKETRPLLPPSCPICISQGPTITYLGHKRGCFIEEDFQFFRCNACFYTWVANPLHDYTKLYDEKYYKGGGADPKVDYFYELMHPDKSIRQYEWRGIIDIVNHHFPLKRETRWLDYGCGNGGLVRYVRKEFKTEIHGYEQGWIAEKAAENGVSLLTEDQKKKSSQSFDVVTAIEVIEHCRDPMSVLSDIRGLLKPSGIFFLTTGNVLPWRQTFFRWNYVIPEIHVSYFEPQTIKKAFDIIGFSSEHLAECQGQTDIIRFKVLKNLGLRNISWVEKLLPWNIVAKIVTKRLNPLGHPLGRIPQTVYPCVSTDK